jgi:hypothetical protein
VGEVEKRPGHASSQQPDDFISKSEIPRETADRLFKLYKERLDHYMYRIGCPYTTLDEVRAKSPILTASICTVAALHDKDSDSVYGICSDEFRRLMGNCMFDRLVKRDSLRAMCIAAYWLSDISWTVSGYAIRRAGDFNLSHSFNRVTAGGGESDADCLRLWYILYICDQHLALLYGRQPIVRDDFSIAGCERFIHSAASTDQDTRLVSQVALLLIFEEMRKLFSQKAEGPLPEEYLGHMVDLEHRMNQWYSTWSSRVKGTFRCVPYMAHPLTDPRQKHMHKLVYFPERASYSICTSPSSISTPTSLRAFKTLPSRLTSYLTPRVQQAQPGLSSSSCFTMMRYKKASTASPLMSTP